MENRRTLSSQCPGVLLRHFPYYFVSQVPTGMVGYQLTAYSVAIPWFTLRQVPVEVEIVSSPAQSAMLQVD